MFATQSAMDVQAKEVKDRMLLLAMEMRLEPHIFALGMADALAATAVTLDLRGDRNSLSDRLDVFCARVEESYTLMRNNRETTSGA